MSAALSLPLPSPTPARTYGRLVLDRMNGEWVLDGMDPHVVIRMKGAFPRVPKTGTQPLHFRDTPEICADLAWFLGRYPMQMAEADASALHAGRRRFDADLAEAERLFLPSYTPQAFTGFRDGLAPYPMQVQAIELARLRDGRCDRKIGSSSYGVDLRSERTGLQIGLQG